MAAIRIHHEDLVDDTEATFQIAGVFAGLTRDAARRLAAASVVGFFGAGERIVTIADPGTDAFLILEGSVVVEDKARVRAYLGAGDLFGEVAALSYGRKYQMRRTATVRAQTSVRALRLHGAALQAVTNAPSKKGRLASSS